MFLSRMYMHIANGAPGIYRTKKKSCLARCRWSKWDNVFKVSALYGSQKVSIYKPYIHILTNGDITINILNLNKVHQHQAMLGIAYIYMYGFEWKWMQSHLKCSLYVCLGVFFGHQVPISNNSQLRYLFAYTVTCSW